MTTASDIADVCIKALRSNNKIMVCGNGGSAADAQHIAAELIGKLNFDRPPLAAMALTTDTSILTAIGNDYGFEYVFARQIEALGKAGDILIAISTSGNSPNIIRAIQTAKRYNLIVIGLTGEDGGLMRGRCDIMYYAPSDMTQEIQEIHMKLAHEFCALIERRMFTQ